MKKINCASVLFETLEKTLKKISKFLKLEIKTYKDFANNTLWGFCDTHTGKMAGMISTSTDCLSNPNCEKNRHCAGSICEKCYATSMSKQYKDLSPKNQRTAQALTSAVIPVHYMPIINALYFRLEAFGDLINKTQVKNYINLCLKNPGVKFALWTKNPYIIAQALKDGYTIPENLVIIFSGLYIDKPVNLESIKIIYPFIDKVFNVFSKQYVKKNNISINCGARSCFGCHGCYEKNNGRDNVAELLK